MRTIEIFYHYNITGGLGKVNYGTRKQYYTFKYVDTDTILEYDITGDSIREIGRMREKISRVYHAVSVVKSADFSQWWSCH